MKPRREGMRREGMHLKGTRREGMRLKGPRRENAVREECSRIKTP